MSNVEDFADENEETEVATETLNAEGEAVAAATTTPVEPEKPATAEVTTPAPVVEEPPQMVPLAALHEARREKDELKRRLEEAEARAQPAPQTTPASQPAVDNDPDPYAALDDDDLPTIGQQKQHEAWLVRRAQREQVKAQADYIESVEKETRQQYTAETAGQYLDYDTVTRAGVNFLTPQDQADVRRAAQPAKRLYELCIERNPVLKQLKTLAATATSSTTPPVPPVAPTTPSTPTAAPANKPTAPSLANVINNAPARVADEFFEDDEGA